MEINYYSESGETRKISFGLRFLSPELRTKIIRYDTNNRKAVKAVNKEIDIKGVQGVKAKIDAKIEAAANDFMLIKPDATKEELNNILVVENAKLLEEFSDEMIEENEIKLQKIYESNDKWAVDFFKIIVNPLSLSAEDKQLIQSEAGSGIWTRIDMKEVADCNASFREKYKV